MSAIIHPSTNPGQDMGPAYTPTPEDTRKEIGGRIRTLLSASGNSFSDVSKQSGIAAAELSSITRGNMNVTGNQLRVLLPLLKATRATFILGLSPDAVAFLDRIFPSNATSGAGANLRKEPITASDHAEGRRVTASGAPDRARARRGNDPARSTNPDEGPLRWGEPTFPGELTFLSFKQCLGRDFKRTDSYKQEISFGYASPCQLEVRVWTTLDSTTGRARPLGSDAIRVVLFDRNAGRKIETWSCILKRVGDCLDRLEAVVGHAVLRAKKRPYCSKCGAAMHICGKPEEQFWGCPNYYSAKRCNGARNLSMSGQQSAAPRPPASPPATKPS